MKLKDAYFLIIVILLIDQCSKIYVKTHFSLNESVLVFDWFRIYFIENNGMAWGTKISDFLTFVSERTAKLALTLFRLCAIVGIGYWMHQTIKRQQSRLLTLAVAFIFAGALGNIIDSVFYGVIFNDSYHQVATLFPEQGGYDSWFHGRVVDMLYMPMWQGFLPEWLPVIGGKYFTFFEPVFNIADVAISIGFAILLLFNKRVFAHNR